MPISIRCSCGHRMTVPDALAGKRLLCDKCRASLSVPGGSQAGKHDAKDEVDKGDPRLKRKLKRSKEKPALTEARWPWIAGGVAAVVVVAVGVASLLWALERGKAPRPAVQKPSEPAARPVAAVIPHNPAPGPGAPAKVSPPAAKPAPAPPPKSPPLGEEDRRLQATFRCELALFGPARFDEEAFVNKSLTGVVVQVQGLAPSAPVRFQAATITARSTTDATMPASVVFIAAGRDGLADTAQLLPNTIGTPRDVFIGAERFRPWMSAPAGLLARIEVLHTVKGHVGAALRGVNDRPEDVLLAAPILLQPQGGVEYGFMPGKKVAVGFLFAAAVEELTSIKLLGDTLLLDPSKRAGKAVFTAGPRNPPAQTPPRAATEPAVPVLAPQIALNLSSPSAPDLPAILRATPGEVRHVAISPRGRMALVVQAAPRREIDHLRRLQGNGTVELPGDSLRVIDLQTLKPLPLAPRDFTFKARGSGIYQVAAFLDEQQAVGVLDSGETLIYRIGADKKPHLGKLPMPLGGDYHLPAAFDGKNVLLPDGTNALQLYDLTTGKGSTLFMGHAGAIETLALSSDRKWVLSGAGDESVRLWDFKSGKELHRLDGESTPSHVVIFPDNRHALIFWSWATVQLWNLEQWQEVRHWDPPAGLEPGTEGRSAHFSRVRADITRVAVVPGERRRVLLGCRDGSIHLWDIDKDRTCLFYVPPPQAPNHVRTPAAVQSLAVSPDGRRVLSGHGDGVLRIWQIPADEDFARLAVPTSRIALNPGHLPGKRPICRLSSVGGIGGISADGKHALTSSGFLRLWSLEPAAEVKRIRLPSQDISRVALSANGRYGLGATSAALMGSVVVRRWDLQTGRAAGQWSMPPMGIGSLALSADGQRASAGGNGLARGVGDAGPVVVIWDVAGKQLLCRGHTSEVSSVAFSPRGNLVVSAAGTYRGPPPGAGSDTSIRIWDARTGKELRRLEGHPGGSLCAVFSPDGKQILSGGADKMLRLWDAKTGKQLASLPGHTRAVRSVAFSADGKRAVSGAALLDQHVLCWDLENQSVLDRFQLPGEIVAVSLGADGRKVCAAGNGTIQIWRLQK